MLKTLFNAKDLTLALWIAIASVIIGTIGGNERGAAFLMIAGFIGGYIGAQVSKVFIFMIDKLGWK